MTALENISFTAPLDVILNVYKLHKDPSNVLRTATVPCQEKCLAQDQNIKIPDRS